MSYPQFEDLKVWQKTRNLVVATADVLTKSSMRDTIPCKVILRDSLSILNNIAKGYEARENKSFPRYLTAARGYAGEFRSCLYVLADLNIITPEQREVMDQEARDIAKMLGGLIKHLTSPDC